MLIALFENALIGSAKVRRRPLTIPTDPTSKFRSKLSALTNA